jgi:hypothetical protein
MEATDVEIVALPPPRPEPIVADGAVPTAAGNESLGTRVRVTYDRAAAAYLARGLFPVPAKGVRGKQPAFCHKFDPKKTELWTRSRAKLYGRWHECEALGLLLNGRHANQAPGSMCGLLVLDFDTKGLFAQYLKNFTFCRRPR